MSVSITRLAALMSVAMLAACGGESASRARGVGGQGAQPGAGGIGGGTSAGTGGETTGAGGSGTGGAGNPDAGADGADGADGSDGGNGSGVVVLTVPFTAPGTGTFFNCPIAAGSAMVLGGHTATFSVCVSKGTANPSLYALQVYATDIVSGAGSYGAAASLTALTTCPGMTPFSLAITNTTVVVTGLGLHISSAATDAAAFSTVAMEVDSISVSSDPVGPYLFMSDAQGFMAATYQPVLNSTVSWQPNP